MTILRYILKRITRPSRTLIYDGDGNLWGEMKYDPKKNETQIYGQPPSPSPGEYSSMAPARYVSGTITAAMIAGGFVYYHENANTQGYVDTAANILAALNGEVFVGRRFDVFIMNSYQGKSLTVSGVASIALSYGAFTVADIVIAAGASDCACLHLIGLVDGISTPHVTFYIDGIAKSTVSLA